MIRFLLPLAILSLATPRTSAQGCTLPDGTVLAEGAGRFLGTGCGDRVTCLGGTLVTTTSYCNGDCDLGGGKTVATGTVLPGEFGLTLLCQDGQLVLNVPTCLAGDSCSGALTILGEGTFAWLAGGGPTGNGSLAALAIAPSGRVVAFDEDVFFAWTPALDGLYELETCSEGIMGGFVGAALGALEDDTVLAVYEGCDLTPDACIANADDECGATGEQSVLIAYFRAGQTYRIRVGDGVDAPGPFGGFDPDPLGAGYLTITRVGDGLPTTACSATTGSLGCAPTIGSTGLPSLTGADDFVVTAQGLPGQVTGFLFFGPRGNGPGPGVLGWIPDRPGLCIRNPYRTADQGSGGTAGMCDGSFSVAFPQSLLAEVKGYTDTLRAQFAYADPGAPGGIALTEALAIRILE